jgi:hypothetical protein
LFLKLERYVYAPNSLRITCTCGRFPFLVTVQTKIPAGLVGLAKLRYLDLSGTMWGVGFPEFIGEIVSLEVLALNDNITGGLPGTGI